MDTDHQSAAATLVLFTLWLVVFSFASQVMIIAPILPRIAEGLDTSVELLGTLITAYALAVGAFALAVGPVSDRFGRRRVLLAGSALMAVALALHGLVGSFAELFVARALAGCAGGVLNGAAIAYVGDYFPRERRGWAAGWVLSGVAAGQIAGIPLGVVLADAFGFRAPFLAFAVVMVVASGLVWRVLPEPTVERAPRGLSFRGAVDGYLGLLREPGVAAAALLFGLLFFSFPLYFAFLPLLLEARFEATGAAVALLFFVGGVANVVAGPEAGRLSDRLGRKPVVVAASAAVGGLMALTPVALVALWPVYVVFFVTMALVASRSSPFQALVTELVGDDRRGSLMSLTAATGQVGFALGGALSGPVFAGAGYGASAALAGASALAFAVVAHRYLPEPFDPKPVVERTVTRCADAFCGPLDEGGHGVGEAATDHPARR
ncbi:MFS transporter [Halomarina ordinaria]|uniref:MFS transporter n=1 Tax=Halomarina ordinaria TaxID=3033939 RepID=A0ABD5UDD2_9EURY|nr:MFS transporter [Halomarina sp. PSRA2]